MNATSVFIYYCGNAAHPSFGKFNSFLSQCRPFQWATIQIHRVWVTEICETTELPVLAETFTDLERCLWSWLGLTVWQSIIFPSLKEANDEGKCVPLHLSRRILSNSSAPRWRNAKARWGHLHDPSWEHQHGLHFQSNWSSLQGDMKQGDFRPRVQNLNLLSLNPPIYRQTAKPRSDIIFCTTLRSSAAVCLLQTHHTHPDVQKISSTSFCNYMQACSAGYSEWLVKSLPLPRWETKATRWQMISQRTSAGQLQRFPVRARRALLEM